MGQEEPRGEPCAEGRESPPGGPLADRHGGLPLFTPALAAPPGVFRLTDSPSRGTVEPGSRGHPGMPGKTWEADRVRGLAGAFLCAIVVVATGPLARAEALA